VAGLRPGVRLRLVGHEPIAFGGIEVDFRPWSPGEQDLALRECDIGLCPMPDTPWTRGKCPYKVLQYMAHAMPWVGSAVGENLRCGRGARRAGHARAVCRNGRRMGVRLASAGRQRGIAETPGFGRARVR